MRLPRFTSSPFKRKKHVDVALGIDIAGDRAAWVRLHRDGDRIDLQAHGATPLNPSRSDGPVLAGVFDHPNREAPCTLVLDREDYLLAQMQAPDVPEKDLRDALLWQIKPKIDFPIQDTVLDIIDFPPTKNQSERRVYAAVANASRLQRKVDWLHDAGAQLGAIDIPELVTRNLISRLPEQTDRGVVLLSLQEQDSHILLCRNDALYLARNIAIGYKRLHRGYGESDPNGGPDEMPDEVSVLLDRMALEIQRTVDFYDGNYSHESTLAFYVTPAMARLPGTLDFFRVNLGLQARVLDLNALFPGPEKCLPDEQITYIKAAGAALRQFLL
jgi:MSHA biogenesis protein MshI